MQHTQSLCENKLFRALYARGKSAAAPCMAVYARKNQGRFLPGYDIVIVARSRALKRPFSTLEKEMLEVFGKLGMTAKDDKKTGIEPDPVL